MNKSSVAELRQKLDGMSFEELLQAIDIYRMQELEKYIRTFMELPVNRSLRLKIVNIMKAVDEMTDDQFESVNAKLEGMVTLQDIEEM